MKRIRRYPDLKAWRTANNLSQHEAAAVLGVSQTSYSRMERGVRAIKGSAAKRIMIVTQVPLEVLAGVAS